MFHKPWMGYDGEESINMMIELLPGAYNFYFESFRSMFIASIEIENILKMRGFFDFEE